MTLHLIVRNLGAQAYATALEAQLEARERVLQGQPDELLLLEHAPPVVTLGRRGGLVDRVALRRLNTAIVETDRGGLATWHGPGQVVGYPIINLRRRKLDVGSVVRLLGATMRETAAAFGVVDAWYDDSRPGVYIGTPGTKLGSIGLHIHRGVTTHGFALNVSCGLEGFQAIEPCGDASLSITTLAQCIGMPLDIQDVFEFSAAYLRSSLADPR